MPDLVRQEPGFGNELPSATALDQISCGAGEPGDVAGETIGEYLRQTRQHMDIDLADISRASKIQIRHLIAIENNAFEELPGRAYAIGFVRSYAACLGVDVSTHLARLKSEMTGSDLQAAVAAPAVLARTDQTPKESGGNVDASSAEASTGPGFKWLAGAAQKALQVQKDRAIRRFKEITKFAGEMELNSSPARSKVWMAGPVDNGTAREPKLDLFSATARGEQTRIAHPDKARARQPQFAPFSTPRRTMPIFLPPERNLPPPFRSDHPVRNWITAGLMGVAIIYFGSSIIHSGVPAAPPPVTPVPARLAAEAAFFPERIARPAAVTPEQPTRGAAEPALAPPAKHEPQAVAATEKPPTISPESATRSSREPVTPESGSAAAEPMNLFHGQLPLGERYGEQNRGSRITLRLHRPSFVAVLGTRNHQYIDRVLRAGDTYRVPNMRGLKLNARDAGAVEVILDGNTVGFAGQDGAAVKGMSLQPQSIVGQFHWLRE